MSGTFRRRHSKWDNIDSEAVTENFHDKAQTRRPIDSVSPSRGSRRYDSRSKERAMTWDIEENNARTSIGPGESRQHDSRSPRNDWGRLYSRSRSRSRSRSPSHHPRRETAVNDRSRNRSGVSGKVCRDFVAGRCRRGSGCHFLHQDAQPYDSRQPSDCSPPEIWESRHRSVGGSRYSPVDTKDYALRTEKPMRICDDYLKGRCRRGASCRYEHSDIVDDAFKEDLIDDTHRDRGIFHNSRDGYSHRNHDRQPDDVYEKIPVDDVHRERDRDRDNASRSREAYSFRNHDREPTDTYEKGLIDNVHRERDNSDRSRNTFSHRDYENRPADDAHRDRDRDRDRDNGFRSRDNYDHRNRDCEPGDMFDKRHVSDVHKDRENSQRSRDTYQNHDRESVGVFEKGPVDNAYRDRDYDHKSRNAYRNHDREPQKRGGIACKFFAAGNCTNGNRCRFIHEVQERSRDDKWGPDHKVESNQVWDGPSWDGVAAMSNIEPVQGWGEDKNEVKEVTAAKSEDNSRTHDMVNTKETWVTPVADDGLQMKDEKPQLQWETGNSFSASRDMENVSGDMEMSPTDIKQHPLVSLNCHVPPLSDTSFATVQPDSVREGFYEKPYPIGFQEQKVFNEPFTKQNPSHGDKNLVYHGEARNVSPVPNMNAPPQQGFFQVDQNLSVGPNSCPIPLSGHFPSLNMNVPPQQGFFQIDQTNSAHPSTGPSLTVPQSQTQFASEISDGNRMQHLSHNPSSFLNGVATEGPHLVNAIPSANLGTVSDEQLVQLSNLSASLAQLLENRQQLPQLSAATIQPVTNHVAPETSKQQYDPTCDSVAPNVQKSGHVVELITVNKVQDDVGGNTKQQEPLITSKDDEKVKKIAEDNNQEPENRASEEVAVDDADNGNKGKDSKAIRPFKFALAEFVKELLKPSWKDGQVSKDAYKAIVKKVVDKIIETQGPQIPQTKDKIDLYLSCSKPKIDKLVQAYVGKFQKNQI